MIDEEAAKRLRPHLMDGEELVWANRTKPTTFVKFVEEVFSRLALASFFGVLTYLMVRHLQTGPHAIDFVASCLVTLASSLATFWTFKAVFSIPRNGQFTQALTSARVLRLNAEDELTQVYSGRPFRHITVRKDGRLYTIYAEPVIEDSEDGITFTDVSHPTLITKQLSANFMLMKEKTDEQTYSAS